MEETWTISQAAEELGVSRVRLLNYADRGLIGPQYPGKGRARHLTSRDLRAAQIAIALTGTLHRVVTKIGRDGLYGFVDNGTKVIAIGLQNGLRTVEGYPGVAQVPSVNGSKRTIFELPDPIA